MQHHIVVLGAGYAGAFSAGYLARQLHSDDFAITVVNAEPDFVERLRLHQLAAGQELRPRPLDEIFDGTGIQLRVAQVVDIDPERRIVGVSDDDGIGRIEYDTLLYALGSTVADHGVPGVDDHAFHVAARPAARRLRARLDHLCEGDEVLIVGGNLTAIECATELAESHPELRFSLVTSGELGGWLGPKARAHLLRAFDRFGIAVHEHTAIERVEAAAAVAADGTVFASGATVWAAGFAVPSIAAECGIEVAPNGQIKVDDHMRSVSHPDIYVAGDSAFVIGENGRPLPMSCASAGPTSKRATSAIVGDRTGRKTSAPALSHVGNHISLGRTDAIFQLIDRDARSRSGAMCGRTAARVKSKILDGAAWALSHPNLAKPNHKYRLAIAQATPSNAGTR